MATSSSTKKAAKLAQKGSGRTVRFQGGTVFPVAVALVLVIGLGLIAQVAVSAGLGWLVYGEAFAPLDWLGAAAIVAALILVRLRKPALTPMSGS